MKQFLVFCGLFLCFLSAHASILPPNNLHLEDDVHSLANMTEKEFGDLIDEVAKIYSPLVAAHGAKLQVEKKWNDSTVNAYAQKIGSTWKISFFGGLARRKEITKDAFQMVVCHETGHLLAGFAFYFGSDMATEGESDYFANQACAKKLWKGQSNNGIEVPSIPKEACDKVYEKNKAAQKVCYRSVMAGQSLANLLAYLQGVDDPDFGTPDESVVSRTYEAHPNAQCRLDSYFQGSLCTVEFKDSVIPQTESEAYKYSCKSGVGARPLCWFAPKQ